MLTQGEAHVPQYSYQGESLLVGQKSVVDGATLTLARNYDSLGRVTAENWKINNIDLTKDQYGYDPDNNLRYRLNNLAGYYSEMYGGVQGDFYAFYGSDAPGSLDQYDRLGRVKGFHRGLLMDTFGIVTADQAVQVEYIRDQQGNLLALQKYNSVPAPITPLTIIPPDDEANGFDAWGRLIGAGQNVFFRYDGLGRKIFSYEEEVGLTVYAETSYFTYSPGGQILETKTTTNVSSDTIRTRYVWNAVTGQDLILRDRETGTNTNSFIRFWALTDWQHNVVAITDNQGTLLERYLYDPLGNVLVRNPDWTAMIAQYSIGWQSWREIMYANSRQQWNILFQGQMREGITGTYYAGNSFYNPATARMLAPQRPVSWWDKHGNAVKHVGYAVASILTGLAGSFFTTPLGGIAIGLATYATLCAYDRASTGQTVWQSVKGGIGDAIGIGGVYTGVTGRDLGTGQDLHLTAGQRAFAGVMGIVQIGMNIVGIGAAARASQVASAAEEIAESAAAGSQATAVAANGAQAMARMACFTRSAGTGMAFGGGLGFVSGGMNSWLGGGSFLDGALEGGIAGAVVGGFAGAAAWVESPACFAAGTQVVVGVEYVDGEGVIREITAKRLSQMGKARRLAVLEKAKLQVVRYLTASIETLQAGDWVITRDEGDAGGELVLTQIAEKFERVAYHLRHLTLRSSNGEVQRLPTTNEHPAYDPATGLWIAAGEFEVGQSLSELPGDASVITATQQETLREGVTVYNFRLVQGHTYFVREQGSEAEPVWVHNVYTDEMRDTPGTVTQSGILERASGEWLTAERPASIPLQVAEKLVGIRFSSLRRFRAAIWLAIANDEELSATFNLSNRGNIEAELAPFAPRQFQTNSSDAGMRFNLHHIQALEDGGAVYDLSNLQIVSPRVHAELHR